MKFKLDFSTNLVKDGLGKGKNGVKISVNGRSIEFRKRLEHENDGFNKNGEKYWDGENNHGWKPQRNGLYYTAFLNLPKNLCLEAYKEGMSYAEAAGLPSNYTLDWVLDEFDSSFDNLAASSLRYHMDWAVTYCDPETREKYENWIKRVEENNNTHYFDDKELEHSKMHYDEAKKEDSDDAEAMMSFLSDRRECKTCEENRERAWKRDEERFEKRQELRKEFIDFLPGLWS